MSQPGPSSQPLGADLKKIRLEQSLTLNQVAEGTRISSRHILNLEEGHYADLPGGMYNRAFLRSYCVYLGLDPTEYLARLEEETAPSSERIHKAKARTQQISSTSFHVPPLFIWSVLLLASVTGLFFSRRWIAAVFSPYFSRPPAAHIPVAPSPVSPAPAQNSQAPAPAATPPVQPAQPPATDVTPPAGSTIQPQAEPVPGTIHLLFEVVQPCWLSVTSDSKRIFGRLLYPGDTPSFDAMKEFELLLGNAGGVRLKINGKPAKPIGKSGAVVRLVINADTIPDLLEKQAL